MYAANCAKCFDDGQFESNNKSVFRLDFGFAASRVEQRVYAQRPFAGN